MSEPGRVLIADEGAVTREVTVAMVGHAGGRPAVAVDADETIRELQTGAFELVLVSMSLPNAGVGETTLVRIRALHLGPREDGRPLAVVGVGEGVDGEVLAAGYDELLARPLTVRSVQNVLARWTTGVAIDRAALDAATVEAVKKIGIDSGQDLWARLVALFLADAGSWVPRMRTAVTAADPQALSHSAHTLSGASGNLGASHLAALCSTLAHGRDVGDRTSTSRAVDAVEVELARVVLALRSSVA